MDQQANQFTTGIAGGPDNRNFHKIVSDCQNLMLVKQESEMNTNSARKKIIKPYLHLFHFTGTEIVQALTEQFDPLAVFKTFEKIFGKGPNPF